MEPLEVGPIAKEIEAERIEKLRPGAKQCTSRVGITRAVVGLRSLPASLDGVVDRCELVANLAKPNEDANTGECLNDAGRNGLLLGHHLDQTVDVFLKRGHNLGLFGHVDAKGIGPGKGHLPSGDDAGRQGGQAVVDAPVRAPHALAAPIVAGEDAPLAVANPAPGHDARLLEVSHTTDLNEAVAKAASGRVKPFRGAA